MCILHFRLEWVRQYMLDKDKIDLHVDFDHFVHLTYFVIIEILKLYVSLEKKCEIRIQIVCENFIFLIVISNFWHFPRYTLWDEVNFRVREMLPSRFQCMNGPMTLTTGKEIRVPENSNRTGVLGLYLYCPQNGKIHELLMIL